MPTFPGLLLLGRYMVDRTSFFVVRVVASRTTTSGEEADRSGREQRRAPVRAAGPGSRSAPPLPRGGGRYRPGGGPPPSRRQGEGGHIPITSCRATPAV